MEETEELKALFRVCVHIKGNGLRCGSPALTGSNFCWQHMGGPSASALARARSTTHDATARLNFAYPEDRESIQHNFALIAEALDAGKIDTRTANTYIRLYRAAEQNLHRWEKRQKNAAKARMAPLETGVRVPETGVRAPEAGVRVPHVSTLRRGSNDANTIPPTNVILSEASNPTSRCHPERSEGPAVSFPEPASGVTDEPSVSSVSSVVNRVPEPVVNSEPKPSAAPENGNQPSTPPETRTQEIDWKKYDDRFHEIDKLYSSQPDYADRIQAAIQEIQQSEAAAQGCPMSRF